MESNGIFDRWNSIIEFDNGSKTTIGDRMIESLSIVVMMLVIGMMNLFLLIKEELK